MNDDDDHQQQQHRQLQTQLKQKGSKDSSFSSELCNPFFCDVMNFVVENIRMKIEFIDLY